MCDPGDELAPQKSQRCIASTGAPRTPLDSSWPASTPPGSSVVVALRSGTVNTAAAFAQP
jgi:hypothetical protein